MAELKKTPISTINEEIISMEFNGNPNIPTANYSEATAIKIQAAIAKKLRAEKLKKMLEQELKVETKSASGTETMGLDFTFKSM